MFHGGEQGRFGISIHALRKESDAKTLGKEWERQKFQSTLSVRRATCRTVRLRPYEGISIHALRKESDVRHLWHAEHLDDFNPRSP